jgi:DNA-binding transcriptional MerR regulator
MTDQVALPEDQELFKLNEVCKLANVQPYMLRFWGTEFPQLEAEKSGTGQRLYSRDQVQLILEIRRLLFEEGLTIAGARKKVAAMDGEVAKADVKETAPPDEPEPEAEAADEPKPKPAKKPAKVKTSTARRKSPKKSPPPEPEVDKQPAADVQPLLATLKDVRDENDKIVTELKSG